MQNQSDRFARLQHNKIFAAGAGGFPLNGKAVIARHRISKAQLRLIIRSICNRNCISDFIKRAASCLNGHSAAGYTSVSGSVCNRDLTIQNRHGLGGVGRDPIHPRRLLRLGLRLRRLGFGFQLRHRAVGVGISADRAGMPGVPLRLGGGGYDFCLVTVLVLCQLFRVVVVMRLFGKCLHRHHRQEHDHCQ